MSILNLQLLNVGQAPDDGTGDKLRSAGIKINSAFSTLNAGIATNVYPVTQINAFTTGSVLQSTVAGYALATTSSGFVGVVATATSGNFSLVTSGLVQIPGVVQGTTYWLDPNNPGAVTTTKPTSAIPVYIGVDAGLASICIYNPGSGGGGGAVSSVAGRTGDVVLSNTDITGLGSAATQSTSAFDSAGSASAVLATSLQKSSNLSDVASLSTALVNLGLNNVNNTTDLNKPISTATQTALNTKLALSGGTMTGTLTLAGNPAGNNDAATKIYVDAAIQGLSWKSPVMAVPTGNVNISNPGTSTFDSYSASSGDRIGLVSQTTASQNGIYIFNGPSSAMTRSSDMSTATQFYNAAFLTESGSVNVNNQYNCVTSPTIIVGTTSIAFTHFGNATGTVVSVGLSMPSGFTVSNSPVTTSGTLTVSTSLSGILKGNGSGFTTATSGTDYAPATSGSAILYGNNAGGFNSVTVGSGLSFSAGTLSNSGVSTVSVSSSNGFTGTSSGGTTPALTLNTSVTGVVYSTSGSGIAAATANQVAAALTGTTGTLNLSSATLTLPAIADSTVSGPTVYSLSSGTAINWSNGLIQEYTLSTTSLSPTFSNPVTGKAHVLVIINTSGSTATITLPAGTGYAAAATATVNSSNRLTLSALYDGSKYYWALGTTLITL